MQIDCPPCVRSTAAIRSAPAVSRARYTFPMAIQIDVRRVGDRGDPLPLPGYATAGSAGRGLRADAPVHLLPGAGALVPTGIAIALPPGYEGQVRPRSGLALRHGVTCLNSPGTIDADYRGEVA